MTSRHWLLQYFRARFGGIVLLLAILIALLAPFLAVDPSVQHDIVATRFLPPLSTDVLGTFHPLGTDRFGRDARARLAYGARVAGRRGVGGFPLSSHRAGGWGGGRILAPAGWRRAVGAHRLRAGAPPGRSLLLLLASLWQPSAALVIIVLGLTGWMTIARLVHGEVRALAARPFVESAVAHPGCGVRGYWFATSCRTRSTPVIVAAALGIGNAIMLEAGLSFLD